MTTETRTQNDIVGSSPEYGGIPHCGIYDCMHFEDDCRICHRSISSGATVCDRHPLAYVTTDPETGVRIALN